MVVSGSMGAIALIVDAAICWQYGISMSTWHAAGFALLAAFFAMLPDAAYRAWRGGEKVNGVVLGALSVCLGVVAYQSHLGYSAGVRVGDIQKTDIVNSERKDQRIALADNYATHKHPNVQAWLAKHPRFHMHFTPTSASWLNMVERFFRDITTERLRRGVFTSVPELEAAINDYVAHHNIDPKPFIWTKSARDILQKVIRANARLSSKQNGTLH